MPVFGWHEDRFGLPPGAIPLGGSIACTYEAFRFDVAAYGLQFHPEVRPGDLASWACVPGYRRLLDAVDVTPDDLVSEVARVASELDKLARQLLGRWLRLASQVAAPAEQRLPVAV